MARPFNPAQHPRDRYGRFTKSRTVKASPKDRKAAREVAESFQPRRIPAGGRAAYLRSIATGPADIGGLRDANRALRAGKPSDDADRLQQAMTALPDDVLLSRQAPMSVFGGADLMSLQGMKVRDAGFAPAQFGTVPAAGGQVRMHLAVPSGTRAAVDADSGEVVLDRDTEMVVAKVAPNGAGGHDMWLTVLPKASNPRNSGPVEGGDAVRAELMKLRVGELQARMRERGLKPGRLRKSQIVDALIADELGDDADGGADPSANTPPADLEPVNPAPAAPSFADRLTAAATEQDALDAAPLSLPRLETHARLGNRNGLQRESREALAAYQESFYQPINRTLRGIPNDRDRERGDLVQQRIDRIDTAMDASVTTRDAVTWRGLGEARGVFGDRLDGDMTGLRWREDAYTSTSARRAVGNWFAIPPDGIRMRVLVPKGTKAISLSSVMDDGGVLDEAELLLGRGYTLQVMADHGTGPDRIRNLDVQVMPS